MTPRIRVPAAWQFGEIDIADARPGAVQRSIVRAVEKELLPQEDGEGLLDVATRFRQALDDISARPNQETQDVLVALGLRDAQADPASPAASATPAEELLPSGVNALCLTLHGLSLAFAGPALTAAGVAEVAAGPTSDDDEPALPAEDARAAGRPMHGLYLRVDRTVAEQVIARLLPKWTLRQGKLVRARCWLMAKVLLECAVQALPGRVEFGAQHEVMEDGEPRTRQDVRVVDSRGFGRRLERMLAALPYRFTMQPLARPVRYGGAASDMQEDDRDSFDVRLIGYSRVNASLERFRAEADAAAMKTAGFRRYVAAVDAQQAVAWRINRRVLATACSLAALVHEPDSELRETTWQQARDAGLNDADIRDLAQWVSTGFYGRIEWTDRRKAYRLPGDLLDHPLARSALDGLAAAQSDGEQPVFYLPWKADYRGRIYAETPWLTPQGGDLQRALFEFAHGRALDDRGVAALRRHGGNLASRAVVVKDLGIDGSGALTLEQREAWVMKREADILRAADNPLAEPFWRKASGDPMQFLAFCLAYAEWKRDPQAPVHAPVQIDGTCNGLQHIAAITGSEGLAQAVNVVARPDGRPGDIYCELADVATARIGQIRGLLGDSGYREGMALADCWLKDQPSRHGLLGRNLAKPVVMTVAYGAGPVEQARQMLATQLIETFGEKPLTAAEVQAAQPLLRWAQEAPERLEFARHLTKGFAGSWLDRQRTEAGRAALGGIDATLALLSFLALALVMHVRLALSDKYPELDRFSAWLRRVAKSCDGVPLCWGSPLQFPVCQDDFKESRGQTISVSLGGRRVSVGTRGLTDTLNAQGQGMQFLPNLIHSLDSTHLAMAIERAVVDRNGPQLRDFGSIHDCVLCHPNDADGFGEALRDTFAELYARAAPDKAVPVVIERWMRWMELLHGIASAAHPGSLRQLVTTPSDLAFTLCENQVLEPGLPWLAVATEVTDLSRRLGESADGGEEAAMQAWLASVLPGLERDAAVRAWCDGVARRPAEASNTMVIEKKELKETRLVLTAERFDAGHAHAAEIELAKLAPQLEVRVGSLKNARNALALCHPEVGIGKRAAKQAAAPEEEMPGVERLLGRRAGKVAPWVADCLHIEAALLRHETRLGQAHLRRLAWLRLFEVAIGVRRLAEADPADGGDPLLAVLARFALDFRVEHPNGTTNPVKGVWPSFEGLEFDVSRVKDSRYFFN